MTKYYSYETSNSELKYCLSATGIRKESAHLVILKNAGLNNMINFPRCCYTSFSISIKQPWMHSEPVWSVLPLHWCFIITSFSAKLSTTLLKFRALTRLLDTNTLHSELKGFLLEMLNISTQHFSDLAQNSTHIDLLISSHSFVFYSQCVSQRRPSETRLYYMKHCNFIRIHYVL